MTHVSTLDLHRLRYGELEPDRAITVRAHLDSCDRCRARLLAQEAERRAFELEPVPLGLHRERAQRPPRLTVFAALAMAAALLLFVSPPGADGPLEHTRLKSGEAVEVVLEGSGTIEPGQSVAAGERLQLRLPPGGAGHVAVTDGRAILGRFEVEAGHAAVTPFALVFDGKKRLEHLHVVTSPRALDDAQVLRAVRGSPPSGVQVRTVEVAVDPSH